MEDIQDPSKTRPAYGTGAARDHLKNPNDAEVPPPMSEVEGHESEIKPGVNTPDSLSGFAKDLKNAASGLAESIEQGVKAVGNKAVDAGAAAKRAVGLESERKAMSADDIHVSGVAGAMEYPPQSLKSGDENWTDKTDRKQAEAKYDEISSTAKKYYDKGEASVNEAFPDMKEAARLQNLSGEREKGELYDKDELSKTLHEKGP